jgi:hypothetical protein
MSDDWKQFDILCLFKMCKELGLVKKNIKTLKDYDFDKPSHHKKIGRKLLRKIIVHFFPHCEIKSRYSCYEIRFNGRLIELMRRNAHINDSFYYFRINFYEDGFMTFYKGAGLIKSFAERVRLCEEQEATEERRLSALRPIPVIVQPEQTTQPAQTIQPEQTTQPAQTIVSPSQERFNVALANLLRSRV